MVKHWRLKRTACDADWIIGAEVFTSRVCGVALRSLKAPGTAFDPVLGKDLQTVSYDEVLANPSANDPHSDCGGAHVYSGVFNCVLYLAAIALDGYSWDRAGKLWDTTFTDKDSKFDANFKQFAELTCKNAETLFGTHVMSNWLVGTSV